MGLSFAGTRRRTRRDCVAAALIPWLVGGGARTLLPDEGPAASFGGASAAAGSGSGGPFAVTAGSATSGSSSQGAGASQSGGSGAAAPSSGSGVVCETVGPGEP